MKSENEFTYDSNDSDEWVVRPAGSYYGKTGFYKEEYARLTAKLATEACNMLPDIDCTEHARYILWITILDIMIERGMVV